MAKFMIGQRVIYNDAICTVCKPVFKTIELECAPEVWIFDPAAGFERHVSESNVKPLPNGQL